MPSLPAIARAASLLSSMHAMTRSSFAVLNAQSSASWQACFAMPRVCTSERMAQTSSKSLVDVACDCNSPANPNGTAPSMTANR